RFAVVSAGAGQLTEQLVVALLRLRAVEPPHAHRDVPRLGPVERLEVLRRVRGGGGLVGERAGLELAIEARARLDVVVREQLRRDDVRAAFAVPGPQI